MSVWRLRTSPVLQSATIHSRVRLSQVASLPSHTGPSRGAAFAKCSRPTRTPGGSIFSRPSSEKKKRTVTQEALGSGNAASCFVRMRCVSGKTAKTSSSRGHDCATLQLLKSPSATCELDHYRPSVSDELLPRVTCIQTSPKSL